MVVREFIEKFYHIAGAKNSETECRVSHHSHHPSPKAAQLSARLTISAQFLSQGKKKHVSEQPASPAVHKAEEKAHFFLIPL